MLWVWVLLSAAARVAEKFIAIFLNLPCCPTKFGFRKIHFTTFYYNYMSNEPDTKQQSDCDSSPGVTAAVIRARLLVTLLTETLAHSALCFWVTCSFRFVFFFLSQPQESRFRLWLLLSLPHKQFLSALASGSAFTSSPLFNFQGLGRSCWAAALVTPDAKELSASMWAWDTGPLFLQQPHISDASWVNNPQ